MHSTVDARWLLVGTVSDNGDFMLSCPCHKVLTVFDCFDAVGGYV